VVLRGKFILDWTIPVIGALVSMMFHTTFYAADDMVATVKRAAKNAYYQLFVEIIRLRGIRPRPRSSNDLI